MSSFTLIDRMFDLEIKNAKKKESRWGFDCCYPKIVKVEDTPLMKSILGINCAKIKKTKYVQTI